VNNYITSETNLYNYTGKYIILVAFNLPSIEKRLWIIEKETHKVILNTYVAHGIGSGSGIYATSFSNTPDSRKSSLGAYMTSGGYIGKHGYSIRIKGLDKTNNNAYNRVIVIHSSTYIGNGKTGHSWGCFAVPIEAMKTIRDLITEPTLLIAYK